MFSRRPRSSARVTCTAPLCVATEPLLTSPCCTLCLSGWTRDSSVMLSIDCAALRVMACKPANRLKVHMDESLVAHQPGRTVVYDGDAERCLSLTRTEQELLKLFLGAVLQEGLRCRYRPWKPRLLEAAMLCRLGLTCYSKREL